MALDTGIPAGMMALVFRSRLQTPTDIRGFKDLCLTI